MDKNQISLSKHSGLIRTTDLLTNSKAAHNNGFKKLAVQSLIEHSTSYQHLWWLDSFVLRNRQLLKPAKRYASLLTTMIRCTLTYCFTLLTSLTIAQSLDSFSISGTIVSTNSGTPISYATIMLTRTKGTISDSLGYFTVNRLKKGQYKLSLSSLGYNSKDTTITITDHDINNLVLAIYTDCNSFPEVNKEMALKDINRGKPKLLLAGGIAPVIYESDKTFQIKYGVLFFDYGCVSPSQECMLAYNKTVFEYLDKTYGSDWRKEIRKDIIGLKDK